MMKTLRLFFPILLSFLLLAGCARAPAPVPENASGPTITFTDDLGRTVETGIPRRTAALIGSFADIWCLAGGRETLVAAASDSWTSFDLDLDESVTDIGVVKTPNLELLLAAEPDFVLASCNTEADLKLMDTLTSAGIPTAYFDVQHLSDYLRMLDICTQLTGEQENYSLYGETIQAQAEAAIRRCTDEAPRILCLRATGSSCSVKGSQNNLLGEMLADLGCINVADGNSAILENLSLEAIMEADPDYIFTVLQGSDDTAARETLNAVLLSNPVWQSLRAVREGRFYMLENALYNVKPNARWGEAYEKLADILYPK